MSPGDIALHNFSSYRCRVLTTRYEKGVRVCDVEYVEGPYNICGHRETYLESSLQIADEPVASSA